MALTRQQIIELINQYIYSNGTQRITGVQLNHILLELANAFAMDGGATAGIDEVLQAGSYVSDGRVITNPHGGKVNLSGEYTTGPQTAYFMGFDMETPTLQGATYTGHGSSLFGNAKRANASRSIVDMAFLPKLNNNEVLAATTFIALGSGDAGPRDGSYIMASSNVGKNTIAVNTDRIQTSIAIDGDTICETRQTLTSIQSKVSPDGPQSSSHIQSESAFDSQVSDDDENTYMQAKFTASSETWFDQDGEIFAINGSGLRLSDDKRIVLTTGGSAQTAGLATLTAGSVVVSTPSVRANSIISLSVQENGTFTGNIRVSAKVANTSFTISSSVPTDNCSVFWQIIDLS